MMDDSLEQRLDAEREAAHYDSSGVFTLGLEQARAKMAAHALAHPETASLKLAQAFCRLGCQRLNLEIYPAHWVFIGRGGREFGLDLFRTGLVEQALAVAGTAESDLAGALVGMSRWPVRGARWQNSLLWGEAPPAKNGLVIAFSVKAPHFPSELWRRGLRFCPMEVKLHGMPISGQVVPPLDLALCLELFHRDAAAPDLRMQPQRKVPALWFDGTAIEAPAEPLGSLAMLLHTELTGKGRFYPVKAGLMLEPFTVDGFPDGLTVVFSAEGLATDLGYFRLRQDDTFQHCLLAVHAKLSNALEALVKPSETHLSAARSEAPPSAALVFGVVALAVITAVSPFISILGILISTPAWLLVLSDRRRAGKQGEEARVADLKERYCRLAGSVKELREKAGQFKVSFVD